MGLAFRATAAGAAAAASLALAVWPAQAPAAESCPSPCTVTTAVDEQVDNGQVSLREAIELANSDAADSTIVLPARHYTLSSQLTVDPGANTDTDTITGAGARTTTIDAQGGSRVLVLPTGADVIMSGVTVTGGVAGAAASGGGILLGGQLQLDRSTIRDNTACEQGGGIAVLNTAVLVLNNSTVSGNFTSPNNGCGATPNGGGISNQGSTSIFNTTISGNEARNGSVSGSGGGIHSSGSPNLYWVTFVGNKAAGAGGNIFHGGNSAEVLASGGVPNNCDPAMDLSGAASGNDHSLSSDDTCHTEAAEKNLDLRLGPLQNNGGPTDTHAVLAGSPAIDPPAGGDAFCPDLLSRPLVDQRGVARPLGTTCDIGAYELVQNANVAVAVADSPDPVVPGANLTYRVTVTSTGPAGDATQPTLTSNLPAGARLVSATPSQGACSGAGPVVCALGTVANGGNATVDLVVKAPASGPFSFTASVASPRPDANSADNSATASTTLVRTGNPGGRPGGGQGNPPVQATRLDALRVTPSRFRARRSGSSIAGRRAPRAARVTYTLSRAATVTFSVRRRVTGRRVGRSCRRATRRNRDRRRCNRYVRVRGSFRHAGRQDANSFRFTGRLRNRRLRPGTYRLRARPAGGTATAVTRFRIVR